MERERERERDQRVKELKRRGASREKREMGFDRTKNRQNTEREEYDREQEKGKVEWRISREDQRGKGIQRATFMKGPFLQTSILWSNDVWKWSHCLKG